MRIRSQVTSDRRTFDGHLLEDVGDGSEGPDLKVSDFVPIQEVGYTPDMEDVIDQMRALRARG
jgi:hypothetical protein